MGPGSWTRQIAFLMFVVVAVAGVLYRVSGPEVATAGVLMKQSAEASSHPEPQTEKIPEQPSKNVPDDASVFASIAENEVTQLREGFTLAQWVKIHGEGDGWERKPNKKLEMTDWPRKECLRYVKRERLPSGASLVRALYFYPPPVPSHVTFPTLSPPELVNGCVLSIVLVEAATPVSVFGTEPERQTRGREFGHALDQAAQQRFTKLYGKGVGMKNVSFWGPGSRFYEDAARWIPHAEIVSGYDPKGLTMPDEDELAVAPFAFVRARLPLVQESELQMGPWHYDAATEAARFHQAVVMAGVDAAISRQMETLYGVDTKLAEGLQAEAEEICKTRCTQEAMPAPTGNEWKEPLVPVLEDWFEALKAADTGRRAAGLVAADRLLMAFGGVRPWDQFGSVQSNTAEQSKRRSELQGLGATFEPGFADAFYHYTGNWLNEAKDLDRDSSGGKLALVTWMSSGDVCGQPGSEAFRKIISEGEALLSQKIDAPTAAQVHFMVGDAYSDIVAIAAGESGGNGEYDPAQYESEAEADRSKALEHYHAGLELDNRSQAAKSAWRQAWHLAARLLPNERYVCFGD
jgi:hypothetical protein